MQRKSVESWVGWWAFALGLALAALVLVLRREPSNRAPGRARVALVHEAHARPPAIRAHSTSHADARDLPEPPSLSRSFVSETDRAAAPSSDPTSGSPSHPIGEERELLQHELQLIGALNDALDTLDTERMRELVEVYRTHHPEDVERMREGYERLLECIEEPGELSRGRALAYYEQARASTLRRYVRRHCLETTEGS